MRSALKNILFASAILAGTAAATIPASALVFLKPKLLVQSLPGDSAIAQSPTQDILLRADGNGATYLYVEQQQGALLAVFDVTDPEHMKLVASVRTEARAAYDFLAPIGTAEQIAFRDGSGTALLDLRKPRAPRLSATSTQQTRAIEPLGASGYLSSSIPQAELPTAAQQRDVQLVASGRHPRMLASLTGVTRQAERPATGTVFLLADGKVNIVRSLDAELQYEDNQIFPNDPD
jgi:hypothetical protein